MNKTNNTYIIAEAGLNHNGSLKNAKKMVDLAIKAGADAIKFQIFKTENLVTKKAIKANYQKKNTNKNETQFEMIKKIQLNEKDQIKLLKYIQNKKIDYLSSPFDLWGLEFLIKNNINKIKIPSGEITNYPLLEQIGKINKKIFLSTGMSNIKEISEALSILQKNGTNKKNITLLQCNTEYPTPDKDANLRVLLTLKNKFKIAIGYSDHTLGYHIPIAAVALGATVIEKHFTLSKKMKGPDHISSMEYNDFKKMVEYIRKTEVAIGDGNKKASKSEIKNIKIARKSIVAKQNIYKGEIFTNFNITTKRPGIGITPMKWKKIIGTKAKFNFKKDELIKIL